MKYYKDQLLKDDTILLQILVTILDEDIVNIGLIKNEFKFFLLNDSATSYDENELKSIIEDIFYKNKDNNILDNSVINNDNISLIRRLQSGDLLAKDELIEKNIALVKFIVNLYAYRGLDYEDMLQEGCIGLYTAALKYDETKGRFSTYAYIWIKKYIIMSIEKNSSLIYIPWRIAKDKNVDIRIYSLNYHFFDEDKELLDFYYNHTDYVLDYIYCSELKDIINSSLDVLTPMQQDIIRSRYELGSNKKMTYKDLALKFNVAVETVRINEYKALRKLQKSEKILKLVK